MLLVVVALGFGLPATAMARGHQPRRHRAHHVTFRPAPRLRACPSGLHEVTAHVARVAAAGAGRLRVRNTFGDRLFGIAAGGALQIEPRRELHRDIADDARAGAGWLRVDVNWAQIQPTSPHQFLWGAIDRTVRRAERCGMHVLGTINYTPAWARPPGTTPVYSPGGPHLATFAAHAARHLRRFGVNTFEIWNEPNSKVFFQPEPDAAAYAEILIDADRAIKAVNPDATVVTGGLAPAPTGPDSISPLRFLRGIYRAGAKGYFDAVGAHPYSWPALPGQKLGWSAWYQMYRRHNSLRSIMLAHGDGAKKIWATEYGAPTAGPPGSSFVSQRFQARMVSRAYRLWAGYRWAGPLFLYQGRDAGSARTTIENFFGFIAHDFRAKPAFAAYQAAHLLVSDASLLADGRTASRTRAPARTRRGSRAPTHARRHRAARARARR